MSYFSTDSCGLGEFGCGAGCSCKQCRSNLAEVYEEEEIPEAAPSKAAPKMGAWFGEPPPPQPPRTCDNKSIPTLITTKPFTISKVYGTCAKRTPFGVANPGTVIALAVTRAIEMLDNTINELVNARTAVCAGQAPAWPLLGDITLEWLKTRLGVCIDDIRAWTAGTFVNRSVAEVIRRLTRVRNLIASNVIVYVCHGPQCDDDDWAYVLIDPNCKRTEPTIIRLCKNFWVTSVDAKIHAEFQAQTILHEASHLYHCTSDERGSTIGVAECLAQFVAATNGSPLDPTFEARCAVTNRCGPAAVAGMPVSLALGAAPAGGLRIVRTKFRPQNAVRPKGRPAARR